MLLGVLVVASQVALAHELAARGTGDLPLRMLSNVPLGIMLGTGLAHLLNREASYRVIDAVLGRRGSAAACLAFAGFIAIVFPYVGFAGEVLVPVALLLLVTATVIREDNDLAGLLQWRPIAWIGTVSYGMYMMHMLAVNLVRKSGSVLHVESGALVFTAAVGVACAIASISFLCYERPFLVLKDRLFRN